MKTLQGLYSEVMNSDALKTEFLALTEPEQIVAFAEKNGCTATMDEIRSKDWSLVPSKYIEFVDRDLSIDFQSEMDRIQAEMKSIMAEEHPSQGILRAAFEGIGYGIE